MTQYHLFILKSEILIPYSRKVSVHLSHRFCIEKKEDILLSPMTKAPTPTVKSEKLRDNTKKPPKTLITQRLRNDSGQSVGVTTATQLVCLNPITSAQTSHLPQQPCNQNMPNTTIITEMEPNPAINKPWPRAARWIMFNCNYDISSVMMWDPDVMSPSSSGHLSVPSHTCLWPQYRRQWRKTSIWLNSLLFWPALNKLYK